MHIDRRFGVQLHTCRPPRQWFSCLECSPKVCLQPLSEVSQRAQLFSQKYRVDVGGKLLTNNLKELVSFRQWDMMEQTYIVNDVKEKCCYVSESFDQDLETCRCARLILGGFHSR